MVDFSEEILNCMQGISNNNRPQCMDFLTLSNLTIILTALKHIHTKTINTLGETLDLNLGPPVCTVEG